MPDRTTLKALLTVPPTERTRAFSEQVAIALGIAEGTVRVVNLSHGFAVRHWGSMYFIATQPEAGLYGVGLQWHRWGEGFYFAHRSV